MVDPARIMFAAGLFLLAACSDSGTLPSRMPTGQPERGSRSENSSSREYVIGVKQRGKLQRYHVRVDKRAQALTINSIGMCDPDVPDSCSACDPNSPECMGPITTVDEPLDDGRVFVGDVSPSESLPVADCPLAIGGGFYLNWRGHRFLIFGTFERVKSLRTYPFGKAEYRMPPGPHESMDGKAIIWSGIVLGSCFGGWEGGAFRGFVAFSWLRGDVQETTSNDLGGETGAGGWGESPDEGSGATTVDTSSGESTSSGSDSWYTGDPEVDKVLKAFYTEGQCTPGWMIFVNDVRVC